MLDTLGLKSKLALIWGLKNFRIAPMGKGFYNIFLESMSDQSTVMSFGTVDLKPGLLRVAQWSKDFNPWSQRLTNVQVWIRIYGLPIEYWSPSNLYSIARGIGLPLKIDAKTLSIENAIFARILVDIDLAKALPERILVKRKDLNFFVNIAFEKLPEMCNRCGNVGHGFKDCRRYNGEALLRQGRPQDNQNNKDIQDDRQVQYNRKRNVEFTKVGGEHNRPSSSSAAWQEGELQENIAQPALSNSKNLGDSSFQQQWKEVNQVNKIEISKSKEKQSVEVPNTKKEEEEDKVQGGGKNQQRNGEIEPKKKYEGLWRYSGNSMQEHI